MTGFSMRIGYGYDAHKFAEIEDHSQVQQLVLGGVSIPHDKSLLAHSDGDVVIHSLSDAILGSLSLGDIGQHFPDSDPTYSGCDSSLLLNRVMEMASQGDWLVVNADITVVAQAPKLSPHIPFMRSKLAALLDVPLDCVSVKATTTEGLGFEGRCEGIASNAVVLMGKSAL